MRAAHWMGKALLAGGFVLVAGSCATDDSTKCTCDLKNDITNTATVKTNGTCAQLAADNTDKYSSCMEASGSIVGPSWPIALQIRKPYEFPTTLLPGQTDWP